MNKLVLALVCFLLVFTTSCKNNNDSNEPSPGIPAPKTLDWNEVAELTGVMVVKFKNNDFKNYVLARKFSKYNDKYYIPMLSYYFEEAIKDKKEGALKTKMPVFVQLVDDYYIVDCSAMWYTALFSNYYKCPSHFVDIKYSKASGPVLTLNEKEEAFEAISNEKKRIQQDVSSDFVNDMKKLVVTKYKWNDYDMISLYDELAKQEIYLDENNMLDKSPFSYIQYVFLTDLLREAGFTENQIYEELEKSNLSPEKIFNLTFCSGLIPIKGDSDWFKNYEPDRYSDEYSHLSANNYLNQLQDIQDNALVLMRKLINSGNVTLPPSLL